MSHCHPNTRNLIINSKLTGRDYGASVYYHKSSADDDSDDGISICIATSPRTLGCTVLGTAGTGLCAVGWSVPWSNGALD